MKKLFVLFLSGLLFYQLAAFFLLYNSSYLNVVSYYTHPPEKGNVELSRLPMFFGDIIAKKILKAKLDQAYELIKKGDVRLAAVITSYEHNQALTQREARQRAFEVAELFILAGYDLSKCESPGKSTASVLKNWGELDSSATEFLLQYVPKNELFRCENN